MRVNSMKSLLSALFTVALVGCASAPPPAPVQPVEAPVANVEQEAHDTTIAHDNWTVTFPLAWKVNDKPEEIGDLTQVVEASSPGNIGRTAVRFSLMTSALEQGAVKGLDPEEEALIFAQVTAEIGPGLFNGAEVVDRKLVVIDGRPASITLMKLQRGLGLALVGTASSHVGYVMTCGGDVSTAAEEVTDACVGIFKTFHAK